MGRLFMETHGNVGTGAEVALVGGTSSVRMLWRVGPDSPGSYAAYLTSAT